MNTFEGVEEYLRSGMRGRACERAFQLACENLLDVCNMIISDEGLGMPRDSRDSVQKLASHNMVSESLALRLGELIGFGNLIVHQYGRVDDSRTISSCMASQGIFTNFLKRLRDSSLQKETYLAKR
ncbi:MAG: DUF86 domain-containing protein [Euryarchaeota archaeon]|nr:DUF86 domain-containing protein [Euryarchaeota archaeon]